jgi:glycosyltransferase involved in cell wall biosynthesis
VLKKTRVLVVAQTPPPYHGQAIMTEYFLQGRYEKVELHHLRMAFSEEIDQVGRAGVGKVIHLLALIVRIAAARIRLAPDVLYYPPAGPNMVPFLRDCVLLIATRWMFPKTAFHFHAAGLPHLFERLPGFLKILFRLAYRRPDVAISISRDGLRDAQFLGARRTALVPNGIPDVWQNRPLKRDHAVPQILFLAMVCEEKGAGVLIEACRILKERGRKFSCKIAGRASSEEELCGLRERANGLEDVVDFVGPVTGDRKWDLFAESDVFCFPTYYASESFGLVAVEAMMTGLPVVTSDWRALPEIVDDGQTGFVVPVKDVTATADRLERLLVDPSLRERLGAAARERFLKDYRVEVFCANMENALGGKRKEKSGRRKAEIEKRK